MNEKHHGFPFPSGKTKVYRFNRAYRVYHFVAGTAALVGGILFPPFLILLAPFSAFMIARPLVEAVRVDQISVTHKGFISERSIPRSSITAVERIVAGRSHSLVLWGNADQKELVIPDLFAFDEDWDSWWRSYRDLSASKPISL